MDLGISSYTYTWAFGVPGFIPQSPMTPKDLIKRAFDYGLQRVQIADNYPLDNLSVRELKELSEFAQTHHILVEAGARCLKPDILDKYLSITEMFGAPFLRFVIDENDYKPDIQEIIRIINMKIDAFQDAGVVLAIENHDRFTSKEFIHIIQNTDPDTVGICLDTVNSFGAGESVREVSNQLLPYTVNCHIKDFEIQRKYHMLGFDISGTPAGSGFLDIPDLVSKLNSIGKCNSCTLELWTSPDDDLKSTIEKENQWSEQSLEYLKGTGLFNLAKVG